jgi:hypothetical protein
MKPLLPLALLASCSATTLPEAEKPDPNTPDTTSITPTDTAPARFYITFANAINDTLNIPADTLQLTFAVHASSGSSGLSSSKILSR